MLQKKSLLVVLVILIVLGAIACILLLNHGKNNTIVGSWSTTQKPHGYPYGYYYYPATIVLYKDGTGVCDGGRSLTWTTYGMDFTINVSGGGEGGGLSEYFFTVKGDQLLLVNKYEPDWTSEYGLYYKRSH